MSHTPNYDAKIKTILDSLAPGERVCEMTGEKWFMDDEEISWYKKFNVPPSPLSPRVRMWHLAGFMTVYQWWWNKNFYTGAPVLTYIHPATGLRVLPDNEWFEHDFSETNLSFSAERPFFEQFRELQLRVPLNATRNVKQPEQSITTVSVGDVNSYFVHGSKTKNSFYTADALNAEACVDLNGTVDTTDCYHINHSQRLHNCQFVYESFDCLNSTFLFDCHNCEYCFGASNKRNKKFLWWNEQLTKETWESRRREVDLGSRKILQKQFEMFLTMIRQAAVWPENFNQQSSGCTGEYLINSPYAPPHL
ncbi:MAG: hypothetical protein V1664_05510 [Candidatus Uhrbacteria bacterium]